MSEAPADLGPRIEAARRAGFYPLMLLLERALGEGARVGAALPAAVERIRFRHDPALAFSPSDVACVRERPGHDGEGGTVYEITTTFLGLTGAASPLPPFLPEEVAQEDPDAPRLRDFLDLFHHRALSLLVRGRARCDLPASVRTDLSDAWSTRVLALLGRDPGAGEAGAASADLLRCAPLLAERRMTAAGLERALSRLFAAELGGARVEVEQFVGEWVDIEPDQQNRLGRAASTLGADLLLGRRVFDRAGRFQVVLGPLDRGGLARLRREEVLQRLGGAVRALLPDPIDFTVVLLLSPEAAPRLRLGAGGARLGRDAWLGGQARETRLAVDVPA